ncbi:VRR-NUC domain-containing protein [Halomonas sp. MCCC 1A17488]|uniref:phosphodiesterase I n=1 Tax=Billgrantia sulfidoxydans TaxID=2733484 RepID=A0ABX7WAC0_9GAMM|nr:MULTISPECIES: VRR-NUC domain-containing protein [Halomonas]MCE8018463.1 VRR-NUC domain-containing protein [Halomonas sp. MCCC 1A17488]MCG3241796.1 VRR-NUC domain-containing protein [Halomonas sp. MCCC 1A17488]QPP49163.1 VRR-NUC domain-containing protein [Halomonas sp. SS10-MC5]QTP56497.1 VRR-NUC domain-containing protein [Halomonas sulfidoxydans]
MNSISGPAPVTASLDDPLYYLANFRFVLGWVGERHGDLLTAVERALVADFEALPQPSQALLVRMVMRKGELFRSAKLCYPEVGDTQRALTPLVEGGWVEADPPLGLAELFHLLRLAELRRALAAEIAAVGLTPRASKAVLQETLQPRLTQVQRLAEWWPEAGERLSGESIVRLTVMPWCDRLRLMFFGNLRQDWAEFVLTELGLQRFERVELTPGSRAFQHREEVDAYLALHALRERLEQGESPAALVDEMPVVPAENTWLAQRRGRLAFLLGQSAERHGQETLALRLYAESGDGPGGQVEARIRRLRLLERRGEHRQAHALASRAWGSDLGEQETQALARLLPRLCRRLGLAPPGREPDVAPQRLDLCLPRIGSSGVEQAVAEYLSRPEAPVHYVENTLMTGLFGLLCWPALFAPLPGAFFHPFHAGPADLHHDDFVARRRERFEACLARLDDGTHGDAIWRAWREKRGLASPFVHWEALDEALLEQALACLPAAHLRACFERLLTDLRANRAGLPDLIQFLPGGEPRYRLIEVKGPGDRLQDNQRRWLAFFRAQGIDAVVCHVTWQQDAAS